MFELGFQLFVKFIFSGILICIVAVCVSQVFKIWFDHTTVMVDFTYVKDGAVNTESGKQFTKLLAHDLKLINDTFFPKIGNSSIPSTDLIGRGENIEIPELPKDVLPNIEIQAYGVQISTLLKSFSKWIQSPNEIQGDVSERGTSFTVSASLKNKKPNEWRIENASNINEASQQLASRIFHHLLKTNPSMYDSVSDESFNHFLRALVKYERYRSRLIIYGETDTASLSEAKTILETTVKHSKFPFVHKLLSYVYKEVADYSNAIKSGKDYLKLLAERGDSDESMTKLVAELEEQFEPKQVELATRDVILRPASQIGDNSVSGLISAIVESSEGKFALTADFVHGGGTGDEALQDTAVIGRISKKIKSALLVEIDPKIKTMNEIVSGQDTVAITGVASSPVKDTEIFAFNRRGKVKGVVKTSESFFKVYNDAEHSTELGSFIETTERISAAGDAGAPVLNAAGQLIGFIYAASDKATYIMPAERIFKSLNISLSR